MQTMGGSSAPDGVGGAEAGRAQASLERRPLRSRTDRSLFSLAAGGMPTGGARLGFRVAGGTILVGGDPFG